MLHTIKSYKHFIGQNESPPSFMPYSYSALASKSTASNTL
jgi:hypothetical protein